MIQPSADRCGFRERIEKRVLDSGIKCPSCGGSFLRTLRLYVESPSWIVSPDGRNFASNSRMTATIWTCEDCRTLFSARNGDLGAWYAVQDDESAEVQKLLDPIKKAIGEIASAPKPPKADS